jgi:dipeptidyl aminopeptidase/acylaminoacyl peptidase
MCAAKPFFLLALAASVASAQWTPAEQMKVVSVGSVDLSPDGRLAAWTQTSAVITADSSEMRTHIWVANSDGSRRYQLTRGDKSATLPQWAPDSRSLYFASDRDGKRQIYRIAIRAGEAEKITSLTDSFSAYVLSPDGNTIALSAAPAPPDQDRRVREKTDWHVVDDLPRNAQLWLLPSDGKGAPRRITSGGEHVGQIVWSHDSAKIAFTSTPTPGANDGSRSDITEVDVETGTLTRLAATENQEEQPRYSPDGRFIAFTKGGARRLAPDRIVILNRASGALRELPPTENQSPQILDWTADSKGIVFMEPRRTRTGIYVMPIDGPPRLVIPPPPGVVSAARLSKDGSTLAGVYQSPSAAPEAYAVGLVQHAPLKLSDANGQLPKHPLGETKVITWKGKDGLPVEGVLTLPVGYEAGRSYPLIVNIHGGPSGVFGENFIASAGLYPIASFAAKGYAVLRPNPRGSTAYGLEFRQKVVKDWGGLDFQDIMTGVDTLIEQRIADPGKLAVMGWSYGGYMTFWTVTQTNRFKAAAAGAGITNNLSMWGTQDIPAVFEDYFDGTPWDQWETYRDRSPLFHVAKATTPLLVLHGAEDPRVPPAQGFEFYRALQRRGIESKMVTYPRTPHGPQEPKFVQDIMERHLEWVEKHLR